MKYSNGGDFKIIIILGRTAEGKGEGVKKIIKTIRRKGFKVSLLRKEKAIERMAWIASQCPLFVLLVGKEEEDWGALKKFNPILVPPERGAVMINRLL